MISKELYEEVQKDYIDFKNITQDEYITIFNKEEETVEYVNKHNWYEADSISIYKLAHKCKEWALSKDYYLRAEQGINYYDNLQWTCFLNINMDDGAEYIDYWNSTEPEAIFKACQWILDNKN